MLSSHHLSSPLHPHIPSRAMGNADVFMHLFCIILLVWIILCDVAGTSTVDLMKMAAIYLNAYAFSIPDSIGKDIEKACQGIYPLHDVYVRKVKVLKKPKFDGEYLSGIFNAIVQFHVWHMLGSEVAWEKLIPKMTGWSGIVVQVALVCASLEFPFFIYLTSCVIFVLKKKYFLN